MLAHDVSGEAIRERYGFPFSVGQDVNLPMGLFEWLAHVAVFEARPPAQGLLQVRSDRMPQAHERIGVWRDGFSRPVNQYALVPDRGPIGARVPDFPDEAPRKDRRN